MHGDAAHRLGRRARAGSRAVNARVMALRRTISMGATPTASVLAGLAAGQVGAPPVLLGFGVLTVMGAGWALWRGRLAQVTLSGDMAPSPASPL